MSCGPFDSVFPSVVFPEPAISPGGVAVQAVPTLFATVVVITFFLKRNRPGMTSLFRVGGLVLGLLATAVYVILALRVFDVLECDPDVSVDGWRWVAVVGGGVSQIVLILPVAHRLPRLGTIISLLLAAGTVAADWALRGGAIATPAADPLTAIQQIWCLFAVILLGYVPSNSALTPTLPTKIPKASIVVDNLTKRDEPAPTDPGDRSWSWFW